MDIQGLQQEIKSLIKTFGMTQKRAAELLLYAMSDDEVDIDEQKINKFFEIFKKQLNRETTSKELLEEYLRILTLDSRGQKHNLVMPVKPSASVLSSDFQLRMKRISEGIEEQVVSHLEKKCKHF